jgi:hypothetical protein
MSREQIHDHQSQMMSSIYRFDVSHRTGVKRGQFRTKKCSLRTGSSGLQDHGKDVSKRMYGPWIRWPMAVLARLPWIRETPLDPFARNEERRHVAEGLRFFSFPDGRRSRAELCESYVGACIAGATAFRIPCKSTIMWAIHFDGRTSPAPGTPASLFCRVERDVRRLVQRLGISCVLRAPCYTDACPDL